MSRHAPTVALSIAVLLALGGPLHSQSANPVAQPFEKLHFRSIGPAIMSGRIADVAVYEKNPAIWYAGTAHGGVWKTTSNGATFTPLLQDQRAALDRRRHGVAVEPRHRLGRHRRVEQSTEHVVGRRRVEVDRRRKDVRERRTEGLEAHQPDRDRSEQQRRRARRGDRTALRLGR